MWSCTPEVLPFVHHNHETPVLCQKKVVSGNVLGNQGLVLAHAASEAPGGGGGLRSKNISGRGARRVDLSTAIPDPPCTIFPKNGPSKSRGWAKEGFRRRGGGGGFV